jgi:aminopeptidase-like protein
LANDNLSGIVVATELARRLKAVPDRPISYRFLFIPATIGAITWLAQNQSKLSRFAGGLVLSNLGDSGSVTYKTSRQQTSLIDRVATCIVKQSASAAQIRDFAPWGYDERQFCSPGFNLPMGRLTRTPDGEYSQYHTSADNLSFIQPACLAESLRVVSEIITTFSSMIPASSALTDRIKNQSNLTTGDLSGMTQAGQEISAPEFAGYCSIWDGPGSLAADNDIYLNTRPYGEPKLDRYSLYQGYGATENRLLKQAVLWILNLSDGTHTFADIAVRSGLDVQLLHSAIGKLVACGLLKKVD